VVASVEGSPHDDWPVSPPLQSLEIENRAPGQSTALLVGMAGKSHWSASARIDPEVPSVDFDVACRVRDSEAGPLGSTYLVGDAIDIEVDNRFGPLQLERQARSVRIAVSPSASVAAHTIRWAYRLIARGRQFEDEPFDRA
jgi:hypothetical protein